MYNDHDVGLLSPYRSYFSQKQNKQRSRSLLAKLQSKRYRVFSIAGTYIESYGATEQTEIGTDFFLMVDYKDTGSLRDDLEGFGKEFDQDSILFIPKGEEKGFLIGTSSRQNSWPGLGRVITVNSVFSRNDGSLTNTGAQPFIFKISPAIRYHKLPEGFMGRMACKAMARLEWREIPI